MKKTTIKNAVDTIVNRVPSRAEFMHRIKIDRNIQVELSGTTYSYNYGELMEISLKIAVGQEGVKEQGKKADIVLNGTPYDIKAIDNYSRASKGHNNDTSKTILIANWHRKRDNLNYEGVYLINNKDIVYTSSGKIQPSQTLAKAKLDKTLTSLLLN